MNHMQKQRGVALPVMMIILLVLLIGSIYMLKSTNSSAISASNLAYESSLSKAADLGLMTGFQWLSTTAANSKATLNANSAANGYVASLDTTQAVNSAGFWAGSVTINDGTFNIEYVVHRMCSLAGSMSATPGNRCMQTAANTAQLGNTVAIGDSLATDAEKLAAPPQLHYVVTSRIFGARGGNVVNQLVILIGA